MSGKVYLVGAGPGDPDLITVKGKKLLEIADVIVYDFLAEKSLLDYAREDAEKIYVGKKKGNHAATQEEINEILVRKAKEGKIVVRLKGGDPFVFGRGGEEAIRLSEEGIPFEVVPGVTSGIAVPAYAGIPVTHRGLSVSVAFITGHEDPRKGKSQIKWEHLTKGVDTLVFLMGIGNLEFIVDKLLKEGRDKDTPSAIIIWGTRPKQKTIVSKLGNIVEVAKKEGVEPPGIFVVGNVVSLREKLKWYEKKPLFGKKIVVTRPEGESDLRRLLEDEGAEVIPFPTLVLKKIPVSDEDKNRLRNTKWDIVIFTSRYGVKLFLELLDEMGFDSRFFGGKIIVAIGEKTAEELKKFSLRADIVPDEFTSDSISLLFSEKKIKGKRILIPRARRGRKELVKDISSLGNEVFDLHLYDSVLPEDVDIDVIKDGRFDAITFTSSQMVRNFRTILERNSINPENILRDKIVASIGPITSKTIEEQLHIKPSVVAKKYTMKGLVEAIKEVFVG